MKHLETQIERLSKWIEKVTINDIPEEVTYLAKLQSLDCIAAICAGHRSQIGKKVYQKIKRKSISGDVLTLPSGDLWSLEDSVYYHSSMINALELDNFSFMGHLSQSAFSTSWALAYQNDKFGQDFLLASIVAQEVSGRISAYLTSGPLQGHMRSFIHRVAAAVVITKIHHCDAHTIANAIAIALSGPEFYMIPSSFSADTKVTSTSPATIEGINSGFLAMEGVTGALDILEHPAGFVAMFSYLDFVPDFWKKIGTTWVMESISFKYYASCGYAQGPVNAALALKSKSPFIKPEEIESVVVHTPLLSVIMENFSMPHYKSGLTQVNVNFSTKRSLALALLYGAPNGDFFGLEDLDSKYESIEKLSKKIQIRHSWKLTIEMIKGFDKSIIHPGYPGLFGMSDSQKTLKRTKQAYQNRTLFEWQDILQLAKLSNGDFRYLFMRYINSLKGKYVHKNKKSHEDDLSKMEFKVGAEVKIKFQDGSEVRDSCDVPKGFAGDNDKLSAVREKFIREACPVFGLEKSLKIERLILNLENQKFKSTFQNIFFNT